MKKAFTIAVILGFIFGFSLIPLLAQDDQAQKAAEGKKILEKSIAAMGGRDRLAKVGDMQTTAELKIIPMDLTATRITYTKGFTKIRLETKVMGMNTVMAYDGKTGWILSPQTGSAMDMPEPLLEELQRSIIGNEGLINPDKYGITVTSEGRKTVEGKECNVLKQTYKDGVVNTIYVDSQTNLPFKTIAPSLNEMLQKVETEATITDYRDVEGMKVPFAIKVIQSGQEYATITMTEYKFHLALEDSLFNRPAN